jgi:hypothetical protein
MQEEMKQKTKEKNEGEEELPGAEEVVPCWSDYFTGGAAVEVGGGVVAQGRHLQAVVLLFQAAEREVPALPLFSSVSFFLSLLLLSNGFSLFYSLFIFLLNSLPCFELPRILSFLSQFCFLPFLSSSSSLSFDYIFIYLFYYLLLFYYIFY